MESVKIHKILYVLESTADAIEEEHEKPEYDASRIEKLCGIYVEMTHKFTNEVMGIDPSDRESTECLKYLNERMQKILDIYRKLGE